MQTADIHQDVPAYMAIGIAERGDAPQASHVIMLTQEQFDQQRIHLIGCDGIVNDDNEEVFARAEKFLDEGRGLTYGTAMLTRLGAPIAADLNQRLSVALTQVLKGVSDETVRLNARWGRGLDTGHTEALFDQAIALIEADLDLPTLGKGLGTMFAKKSPAYAARRLAYGYLCQEVRRMYEGDHAQRRLAA